MRPTRFARRHGTTSRRAVLAGMGAAAPTLALPRALRAQSAGTIRIGFLTPLTGPLALFGATDGFTVARIEALLAEGLEVNGQRYDVQIIVRDSQSDPNRAAEVAADLILNQDVHILIPATTTDTINPAADQAELFGCPCLSTGAP